MDKNSGPLQCQYLNIAEVVSSMTAESRVDQHSIQPVDLGLPLGLRHEGPQIQVLRIFHILMTKKQLINIKLQSNIKINKSPKLWVLVIKSPHMSWYLCDFAPTEVCKAF